MMDEKYVESLGQQMEEIQAVVRKSNEEFAHTLVTCERELVRVEEAAASERKELLDVSIPRPYMLM
jgi:predicted dithiol-disulfide oxidoreductase (DUF899 family)